MHKKLIVSFVMAILLCVCSVHAQTLMMASPWTNGTAEGFTLANYSGGWSLMAATPTNGPYYQWSFEVQPNNNWWYGGHSVGPLQKLGTVPAGAENDLSKWTVKVDTRVINMPLVGGVGKIDFQILSLPGGCSTQLPVGSTSWTTHQFTMDKMWVTTNAYGVQTPFDPTQPNYQVLMQIGAMGTLGWAAASPPPTSNAFAVALRDYTLYAIPEPALGLVFLGGVVILAAKRRA